jgi:hypothetical protein
MGGSPRSSIVTGGSEVHEGLAAYAGQLGPADADAASTGTGECARFFLCLIISLQFLSRDLCAYESRA